MVPSVLLLAVATLLQSLRGHHMPTSGGLFSRNLRKTYPLAVRGEGCWILEAHKFFERVNAAGQNLRDALTPLQSVFTVNRSRAAIVRCNRVALLLEKEIKMQLPLRSLAVSFIFLLILTFALSAQLAQEVPPGAPILGFSPPRAAAERQLESTFQSIPSPEKAREWHRTFTAEPHPAASERNNQLADFVADAWRKQGWEDVMLRRYDVLHSRPRSISLEMTEPVHFTASLREDAYDVDPDTKNPAASGSFFGYSASGDVTAEVVYAHSGNPEDYDVLRKNGISVKGKIVLVRYSNPYSYRGFKALIRAWQSFSGWPVGPGKSHPARLDHLRLHRSRRSHDTRMGVRSGRKTHRSGRGALAAKNRRTSSFVARCETTSRKHERPRSSQGLAGSFAHHVSLHRRGESSRQG